MTGTVLDGEIDIAALRTDGADVIEAGPFEAAAYAPETIAVIAQAMDAAAAWAFDGPEPAVFAQAEAALTGDQSAAVSAFCARHALRPAIIGFHGQTVLHRPPGAGRPGATRQLGDGAAMAVRTGAPVAFDFRSADIAAGGQGAPLAPVYHAARLRGLALAQDTALLNLGGVGNLTAAADRDLIAFDTGPANAPLNDWLRRHAGAPMDRDGALAAQGAVDEARLARILADPWFAAPPPKSLDRNSFTAALADGLSPADGAATLTALAAATAARGLDHLPRRPSALAVGGGGARNPTLMAMLAARTGLPCRPADALGLRGDALEAECFAYLAVRAARGLALSFPGTTGAPVPMTGGRFAAP